VVEEDWGFIHWSQSCVILDKAVFSRSEYHRLYMVFKYVSVETGKRSTPVKLIFDHKTRK
jgi:hypothetical protein